MKNSPLIANGLLGVLPDATHANGPLLNEVVKLDPQAVDFLVGNEGLDGSMARFADIVEPGSAGRIERSDLEALASIVRQAWGSGTPMVISFQGPRGMRQREAAESVASAAEVRLLVVDLSRSEAPQTALTTALQYAWLHKMTQWRTISRRPLLPVKCCSTGIGSLREQRSDIPLCGTSWPTTTRSRSCG